MYTMHIVQRRGKFLALRHAAVALSVVVSGSLCCAARPCAAQLLSSCDPRASADFDGWFSPEGDGGDSDSARNDPLYYILGFASLLSFVHFDQLGGPPAPTRVPVAPSLPGTQNGGTLGSGGNAGDSGNAENAGGGGSGDTPVILTGNPLAGAPGTPGVPGDPGSPQSAGTGAGQTSGETGGSGGSGGDGGSGGSGGSGGNGSPGNNGPGDGTGVVNPGPSGTVIGDDPWNGAPPGNPSDPSGPSAQDVTPEPGPALFGLVLGGTLAAAGAARIRAARRAS